MSGSLTINDTFPNFTAETQDTDSFDLYEYLGGSWGLIFTHPGDFTPVCTTELGEFAKRQDDFAKKQVKMCGMSCSDADSHKVWIEDIRAVTGAEVTFPLVADHKRSIAAKLGILDRTNIAVELANLTTGVALTVRTLYIVKPDKTIAATMTYPATCGRNMDEISRVIDALQLAENQKVETPVNWKPGDEALVYFLLSDEDAEAQFGKDGYKVQEVPSEKKYMRWVKT